MPKPPGPIPATSNLPPAACSFVLRLWRLWTAEGPAWRGWIEHVPSGEQAAVQDWEGVAVFMQRFGVEMEEDR